MKIFSRNDKNKEPEESSIYGHSLGDLGVIAIAALIGCAGILMFFAKFTLPAAPRQPAAQVHSGEVSVGIAPAHK